MKRRFLMWGLLALALSACSDLAPDSPLSHARRTPETLAQAALDALKAQDDSALKALQVTRAEYEELLWPEMPDGEYTPFEFVWSVTEPRSRNARNRVMEDYGGLDLKVIAVSFGEESEAYPSFTLFRDARLTVVRMDTQQEMPFPLMDGIVVMGGGWKFLNFIDEL